MPYRVHMSNHNGATCGCCSSSWDSYDDYLTLEEAALGVEKDIWQSKNGNGDPYSCRMESIIKIDKMSEQEYTTFYDLRMEWEEKFQKLAERDKLRQQAKDDLKAMKLKLGLLRRRYSLQKDNLSDVEKLKLNVEIAALAADIPVKEICGMGPVEKVVEEEKILFEIEWNKEDSST